MKSELKKYQEKIIERIFILRGEKVMLDFDLALLYGVETKRLKEAVQRNINRFPKDFMFQLKKEELDGLRSQNASFNIQKVNYLPFVFTEQGIAMISSVLNSEQAIHVNIQIIRLFTQMRKIISENKEIMLKLEELEKRISKSESKSEKFEQEIAFVFQALRSLLDPVKSERKRMGFKQ